MHAGSESTSACVRACLDCYQHCQNEALTHCLEIGGKHIEPTHFRLMFDCAEASRSAAALMMNGSTYHAESCRLCARICRDCAKSCRDVGDMDKCADVCEHCAELCEAMAAKPMLGAGAKHASESRARKQ